LKLQGSLLVLSEGAVLISHHLNRDRDYRKACAVVEPNPRQPGRLVLRTPPARTWRVVPDGEEPKRVAPNQRLGVRPMRIDFGPARGQILSARPGPCIAEDTCGPSVDTFSSGMLAERKRHG